MAVVTAPAKFTPQQQNIASASEREMESPEKSQTWELTAHLLSMLLYLPQKGRIPSKEINPTIVKRKEFSSPGVFLSTLLQCDADLIQNVWLIP